MKSCPVASASSSFSSLHFATLAIVWHIFWFCLVDCLISFLPVTGSNCSASSMPNFFSFLVLFLLLLFVVCSLASWAIALNGKHFTFVTRSGAAPQGSRSLLKFNDISVFMTCFMHNFQSCTFYKILSWKKLKKCFKLKRNLFVEINKSRYWYTSINYNICDYNMLKLKLNSCLVHGESNIRDIYYI